MRSLSGPLQTPGLIGAKTILNAVIEVISFRIPIDQKIIMIIPVLVTFAYAPDDRDRF